MKTKYYKMQLLSGEDVYIKTYRIHWWSKWRFVFNPWGNLQLFRKTRSGEIIAV